MFNYGTKKMNVAGTIAEYTDVTFVQDFGNFKAGESVPYLCINLCVAPTDWSQNVAHRLC